MPFRLDHINVWAIDTHDGWVLVDTGLNNPDTVADWLALMAHGPLARPLQGVFATHMHPDHIGLAGWFTRRFGVPLHMSRLEYLTCRVMHADTNREAPPDGVLFNRCAGWSEAAIESYRSRFGSFGKHIHALPDSYRRLQDGDHVQLGKYGWRIITTGGHSPEHASLYCPDLKLLISGDQVLPKISSNVSVFPTEPDGDPLTEWLTTLAAIKDRVDDEVLVLPAHNEPFYGLHARIDHLIGGHERGLARLRKLIAEPKRAVDVFPVLFRRKIDQWVLGMATGESLAHLNCLMARGQAVAEPDEAGVIWYRAA